MAERHIVIVGGGFTGTALAIHLARLGAAGLTVTVIEPRSQLGRGVAYGTLDPAHRINVPAERMQLSAEGQGDFERWYRASAAFVNDPQAEWHDGKTWPQRGQFGAWVAEQFEHARQHSPVKLRHLCDRAVALKHGEVITEQGDRLQASDVVLAISHPPPAIPRQVATALEGHAGLIANPWQNGALDGIAAEERIAIMGSGLSMSDVVATLQRHGHRGSVLAFSRRGLLPRSNLSGSYAPRQLDYQQPQVSSARAWLRRIRHEIATSGEPWQLVLDDIRLNGQRLWQQLPLAEQQRFLRHLRPWWDVHRYRIAPQVSAVLEQWQASGQLQVVAARLQALQARSGQIALRLQPRGAAPFTGQVDRLILTTGPAHGSLLHSNALLHQLAAEGTLQADALSLGIAVNACSQTLNTQGAANPHLYVAGPAARGRFGELMGLPQVAEHAESVARQLLGLEAERCPR